MILGLSDTEKKFKTAMDTAGADMTVVNSWLKPVSYTHLQERLQTGVTN